VRSRASLRRDMVDEICIKDLICIKNEKKCEEIKRY
jgi:hypothetical protein